jgi:hypothetical protein
VYGNQDLELAHKRFTSLQRFSTRI